MSVAVPWAGFACCSAEHRCPELPFPPHTPAAADDFFSHYCTFHTHPCQIHLFWFFIPKRQKLESNFPKQNKKQIVPRSFTLCCPLQGKVSSLPKCGSGEWVPRSLWLCGGRQGAPSEARSCPQHTVPVPSTWSLSPAELPSPYSPQITSWPTTRRRTATSTRSPPSWRASPWRTWP